MNHNFYPGPSTLHPYFEEAVQLAISSGALSMNHRSTAFSSLYQQCFETLQEKWDIPADFSLLFVSSATETWEIIAQSLIIDEPSLHISNGAFGKKSFDIAKKLTLEANNLVFPYNEALDINNIEEFPFINICQNETSNGTAIANHTLQKIRNKFPKSTISIDVTSSLGGVHIDFENADIWYSSVQKCLGLPSGIGLILINNQTIELIQQKKNIDRHYNDLSNIISNAKKWQTTHTPNILNIHALAYTQSKTDHIINISNKIISRNLEFLHQLKNHTPLVPSTLLASPTVITVEDSDPTLIIEQALKEGIILGKGYERWEKNTFRIANFPSISNQSFEELLNFLNNRH